jgi:hypothetical protein
MGRGGTWPVLRDLSRQNGRVHISADQFLTTTWEIVELTVP